MDIPKTYPVPAAPMQPTPQPLKKSGLALIKEERARQIEVEGWTPEHDDEHRRGELAKAADAYRTYAEAQLKFGDKLPPCFFPKQWPWERAWWKPSADPVRNLVKAGALYQAQADFYHRRAKDELELVANYCVGLIAGRIDELQA